MRLVVPGRMARKPQLDGSIALQPDCKPGSRQCPGTRLAGTAQNGDFTMADAVTRFTRAVETASIPEAGSFAPSVVLDATVPHWRFSVHGSERVEAELGHWFADPGRFEELTVTPLANGALVRFVLTWEEDGEPHMCHQAHLLEVQDDLITRDIAWCGGRWGAALQAEMAEAAAGV